MLALATQLKFSNPYHGSDVLTEIIKYKKVQVKYNHHIMSEVTT